MTPRRNKFIERIRKRSRPHLTHPDFYNIDDLLTEEHKMVRNSVRDYVKRDLSPIIEACAENNYFPTTYGERT